MKIFPEIEVRDPQNIPTYTEKFVKDITDLLSCRISESKSAKKIEANLFLYIFVDNHRNSFKFEQIKTKLFWGINESMQCLQETKTISEVLKRAIVVNLDIPDELNNCYIYLSLCKLDTKTLFNCDEERVKPQYTATEPMFSLDEVIMNDSERKAIMRAITLVKEKELIYRKWNFKKIDKYTKSIMCFHGVPGTGKTMAAHAVANYLGKKILVGSYAQIESEFVGVGAKNLVGLFDAAREQDSVLFIDEADTFLSKRLPSSNDSSKHYNSMSNELYQLIESFDGCIIFASNHIKDFDPAVVSRIIEPVEFKLPDTNARKQILKSMIQEEFPIEGGKTDRLIDELSKLSEGFSGRDLRKALLVSYANAAYTYKTLKNAQDEEIVIPPALIFESFHEVRTAKELLERLKKGTLSNVITNFTKKSDKNTRYLQIAAHALLCDGTIDSKEKELFEELSKMFEVNVPLIKEELPDLETLCVELKSKEEKIQALDVATRMFAIDYSVPEVELKMLNIIAEAIGVKQSDIATLRNYTIKLAEMYQCWENLVSGFVPTDIDILKTMRTEYTEAAAYYHLGLLYINGNTLYQHVVPNEEKAKKYLQKSADLGFSKAKEKMADFSKTII